MKDKEQKLIDKMKEIEKICIKNHPEEISMLAHIFQTIYVKQSKFIKQLKKDWRLKARRMEIMSGEVAIFELESLIDKIFGGEYD